MGTRYCVIVAGALLCVVSLTSAAFAQQGVIKIDRIHPLYRADTVFVGVPIRFAIRYTNDSPYKVDVSNGFRITTPDGAIWDSVTIAPIGQETSGKIGFTKYFDIASSFRRFPGFYYADTVAFLGAGSKVVDSLQLPAGFDDTVLAIKVWFHDVSSLGKHICIDSCFYRPGGTWLWLGGEALTRLSPVWEGPDGVASTIGYGYCFLINMDVCPYCPGCCYAGGVGNIDLRGVVDVTDLSCLVSYLTGGGYNIMCDETANVDGKGIIDATDLTCLISYLTGGGFRLPSCP